MSDRTGERATPETTSIESEQPAYAPDGGVTTDSTSTGSGATPRTPSIDDDPQDDVDPRTERARNEEMAVSLLKKGGVYEVRSSSGNIYEVDVATKTCTCPDFENRQPSGGCKHLRRVDMDIRSGVVPRPDGQLPTTADIQDQLREAVHELEREIETREAKQRELQTALAVLEAYSN